MVEIRFVAILLTNFEDGLKRIKRLIKHLKCSIKLKLAQTPNTDYK